MVKKSLLLIFLFVISSCASVSVDVEEALAPQVISELAYNEFNKKAYKKAIAYYQVIIDRFDRNLYPKEVAWAYYEIGFCYYYQGKYKEAIPYFDIVLKEFAILPARILSSNILETIYEKKPDFRPVEFVEDIIIEEDTVIEEDVEIVIEE